MADDRQSDDNIRNGDLLSGAILLVLGLYIAYEALQMSFGSIRRPGPGFFPVILAVLLIVTAGVVAIRSLRFGSEAVAVGFGQRTWHILVTIAAVALYTALLETVGFLLCTLVLTFALLKGMGRVSWLRSAAIAIGGTVGLYLIFTQLGIPLPKGLLEL